MGKGARVRSVGGRRARPSDPLGAAVRAANATAGVGRPSGASRARTRAMWAPKPERPVDPWQGYGNAIVLGLSKIARWKNGEIKRRVADMDDFISKTKSTGLIKSLADVQNVAERDEREMLLKS